MTDTQVLLRKIAALRQQLEQVQGLAADAADTHGPEANDTAGRIERLERQVSNGAQHTVLLDTTLRQLAPAPAAAAATLPRQLTARARRILEQGRELVAQLRLLGEEFPATQPVTDSAGQEMKGALARRYHETAAMADTALRMLQAFPDAASVQLRLCEGLEAMLGVVAERIAGLHAAVQQRRFEQRRIDALADLITQLHTGLPVTLQPFADIADAIVAEAAAAGPLRFLSADPRQPARFVASHGLNTAQVLARVVRDKAELRCTPVEAVLAAMLHDVGMLGVDPAILARPGPVNDAERRAIEAHTHAGAEMLTRLLPGGAWLAEAALGHHERLDGTGYPGGLRDQQIAPLTRLIAVCDIYAALCTPRPHRPALDTRTALTDTLLLAEGGGLDRYQAERLLQLSFYPVGSLVELADGAAALVVATPTSRRDLQTPARPVLAVLTDGDGQLLPYPRHVDLAQCEGRSIVRLLPPSERSDRLGSRYPELV